MDTGVVLAALCRNVRLLGTDYTCNSTSDFLRLCWVMRAHGSGLLQAGVEMMHLRDVWVGLKPTERLRASRGRRSEGQREPGRPLFGMNGEVRSKGI